MFEWVTAIVGLAPAVRWDREPARARVEPRSEPVLTLVPSVAVSLPPPMVRGAKPMDASRAVGAFVAWLREEGYDAEPVRFAHLERAYVELASERGWPGLPPKALAIQLASHGAVKSVRDARHRGRGRVTYYAIPAAKEARQRHRRAA